MPLDVRGCTRATLKESTCLFPCLKGLGNPLKLLRAWDRELQLFPLNEEYPVGVGHKLALITSLPFVHTARRYEGVDHLLKSLDWSVVGFTDITSEISLKLMVSTT